MGEHILHRSVLSVREGRGTRHDNWKMDAVTMDPDFPVTAVPSSALKHLINLPSKQHQPPTILPSLTTS
jgi:hypothetical protein